MKIAEVNGQYIQFDNGSIIAYDHSPDCCEWNYADFLQIRDDVLYDYDFDPELDFEKIDGSGFRFGSNGNFIFVPCYSEQNGWYSSDIDILYIPFAMDIPEDGYIAEAVFEKGREFYNQVHAFNLDCEFCYR